MHGDKTDWVNLMGQEIVIAGLHWIPENKLQLSVGRGCVGWRSWVSAIHTPNTSPEPSIWDCDWAELNRLMLILSGTRELRAWWLGTDRVPLEIPIEVWENHSPCSQAIPPQIRTCPPDERGRYARHLILPEVGLAGQERLKAASVICIGAGGLGSPLLLYLAAAGVGRIGIVDGDAVELSNLQRQVIHGSDALGRSKGQSLPLRDSMSSTLIVGLMCMT